ncbi:MAG: P-II family nitrogen regulator [Clostridiales bacterium]
MKEVMAIIRMNMIGKTKEALSKENFPSMSCRRVMGRGKKKVDYSLIEDYIKDGELPSNNIAEAISEGHRLIPKRLLTLIVKDDEVDKVVDTIIKVNTNGKPGDGKIFVIPIIDSIRVRTGETGDQAI